MRLIGEPTGSTFVALYLLFRMIALYLSLFTLIVGKSPQWLRTTKVNVPDHTQIIGDLDNFAAVMEKKRPLICVYDFQPEFNSLLLEVRMLTTIHS